MRGPLSSVLVLGLLSSVSCTSASGDVHGGDTRPGYDASAPAPLQVTTTEDPLTNAAPTSWRGLYRDFFGRHATATCAGNGTCHDTPQATGSKTSSFLCADVDGCWQSLRTAIDPRPSVSSHALVEEADIAAPEGAYLFRVIRFRTKDGQLSENRGMPQVPSDYAFTPDQIDRMQAWIRSGAKND